MRQSSSHSCTVLALALAALLGAAPAAGERGDPASRLPDRSNASEYWDLYAHFETGERIFVRFLITNEGPGERAGVTIGTRSASAFSRRSRPSAATSSGSIR